LKATNAEDDEFGGAPEAVGEAVGLEGQQESLSASSKESVEK
jgi:hypothetical protein